MTCLQLELGTAPICRNLFPLFALAVQISLAGCAAAVADSHLDVFCELVWEISGETEDYLLGGLLVDAGRDADGNLCFVDYNNKDLKLFSPDGRYLRTLGRAGDGPGECRDARRLLLAADGRLGLLQVFPACVVWLNPDGTPGGRITMQNTLAEQGGFMAAPHAVQHKQTILVYASSVSRSRGVVSEWNWIAPLQPDGTLGGALFTKKIEQPERDAQNRVDEGDYYDLWAARWAPDGQGGVWLAPQRDSYQLVRNDQEGAFVQTVTLPYTPVVRDDLARRQVLEQLGRKRLGAGEIKLRPHAPVVRSLRLSEQGQLWVDLDLGGRGPVPGTIAWLDILDADGDRLRQIRLHGPFDPETDQWRFIDDEHLFVLHSQHEGAVSLRLLRWQMPGS